jgi:hypothetical protein
MQIDLPQDIIDRVQLHLAATPGANEADVIRKAFDALDWLGQERQAIQEGIDAWRSGDVQDFDEFDREFRARNGMPADA